MTRTVAEIDADIRATEAEAAPVRERAARFGERLHALMVEKQEACSHPLLSCRKGNSVTGAPVMVCVDCGLAEEMWGSGTEHFKHVEYNSAVAELRYGAAMKLATRFRSQRQMYRERYPERFDEHGNERDR